jgi:hypothetical protein
LEETIRISEFLGGIILAGNMISLLFGKNPDDTEVRKEETRNLSTERDQ